ncbi:hypothetical protein GCM10019017_47470 [Streptomyces showdoensis]
MRDPEEPADYLYGRICWAAACAAWRRGEDPSPWLGPPVWRDGTARPASGQ